MKDFKYDNISIDSILVWKENPRHERADNEKEAIEFLFKRVGSPYMNNLAKDICSNGISPYDLPIVVQTEFDKKRYYAYEGNRRMAVIKSILKPELVLFNSELHEKYKNLNKKYGQGFKSKILCVVTDHDSAVNEIQKIHFGEQNGIGRKKWGKFEKDMFNATFKNETSIILNIVDSINDRFNENILDKIEATNINRIFQNKQIKEILKTNDYGNLSDNDIDILYKVIQKAIETEKLQGRGLSRIFNTQESISRFFKPYIEEIRNSDVSHEYNIRADNININQNGNFSLDMLNVAIYDKNGNKVNVNEEDLEIKYYNPKFKTAAGIDTSSTGLWQVAISYKNANIRSNVKVNENFSPKITLKNSYIEIKKEETFNLSDNIKEAKDSLRNNVKDKVRIIDIGEKKAELVNNIFTNKNGEGEYKIKYGLTDENSIEISKVLNIIVINKKEPLKAKNTNKNCIFNIESIYNVQIDISYTVNKLINQLSQLDVNKYDCVVATSLRALLELSIDETINRKSLSINYSANDNKNKDKLLVRTNEVVNALKRNISSICTLALSKFNYHTMNNFLNTLNVNKMLGDLNLGAHKSMKIIVTTDLSEVANKQVAVLLVLIHYYLKI